MTNIKYFNSIVDVVRFLKKNPIKNKLILCDFFDEFREILDIELAEYCTITSQLFKELPSRTVQRSVACDAESIIAPKALPTISGCYETICGFRISNLNFFEIFASEMTNNMHDDIFNEIVNETHFSNLTSNLIADFEFLYMSEFVSTIIITRQELKLEQDFENWIINSKNCNSKIQNNICLKDFLRKKDIVQLDNSSLYRLLYYEDLYIAKDIFGYKDDRDFKRFDFSKEISEFEEKIKVKNPECNRIFSIKIDCFEITIKVPFVYKENGKIIYIDYLYKSLSRKEILELKKPQLFLLVRQNVCIHYCDLHLKKEIIFDSYDINLKVKNNIVERLTLIKS